MLKLAQPFPQQYRQIMPGGVFTCAAEQRALTLDMNLVTEGPEEATHFSDAQLQEFDTPLLAGPKDTGFHPFDRVFHD
tara:strand:- start:2083 stop:2316 length:234 start_codon:yes stop_codon:yes gene_type:complete